MEWDPSRFFCSSDGSSPYALLVLNQPINERAFEVLQQGASYIICADGGANRLYDMMQSSGKESPELPDMILGDLDSLRPSVRQHYEKLGVSILQDLDQDSTDFTKCLKYLNTHAAEITAAASPRRRTPLPRDDESPADTASSQPKQASIEYSTPLEIVILGGLGGRVDQAFSQIHHLYMMTQTQREASQTPNKTEGQGSKPSAGGNLYLVSEESITFVLQQGKNIIHTPATKRADIGSASLPESQAEVGEAPQKRKRDQEQEQEQKPKYFFEENIGIIPLSATASITTRGFEWDVQDWRTEIGGQISTSNHIRADTVEVETSVPVLFTVELAERLKRA